MKPFFKDSALSFEDQVSLLERQGLIIEDRGRALQVLQNVSYSRLKAYLVPLMTTRSPRRFLPGATFEMSYIYYGFDRRLRELVFHELEKIEVSVRTRFGYASAGEEGGMWYLNPNYFKTERLHNELLRNISGEVKRTDIDAVKHFYEKYSNQLPPCWMAMEAVSMGTLSRMYDDLKPGAMKREIAGYYHLSDTVLSSWLHHLVYIRNTCAHHNRLWNKNLSITALIPQHPDKYFPIKESYGPQKVYTTVCIVKYLLNTVKPDNNFALRLKNLITSFPKVDARLMGFPPDWNKDPFWK